jgi:hypothetical protein
MQIRPIHQKTIYKPTPPWKGVAIVNSIFYFRDSLETLIGSLRMRIEDESNTELLEGIPGFLSLTINSRARERIDSFTVDGSVLSSASATAEVRTNGETIEKTQWHSKIRGKTPKRTPMKAYRSNTNGAGAELAIKLNVCNQA